MTKDKKELRIMITEKQYYELRRLSFDLGISRNDLARISLLAFMDNPTFQGFMEVVKKNYEEMKKRQKSQEKNGEVE